MSRRAAYALAILGLTHEDLLTIRRGFVRQLDHEVRELLRSFE